MRRKIEQNNKLFIKELILVGSVDEQRGALEIISSAKNSEEFLAEVIYILLSGPDAQTKKIALQIIEEHKEEVNKLLQYLKEEIK